MRPILFALSVGLLASPARASDQSDVVAAAHAYLEAYDRGDAAGLVNACAPDAVIISETPPHVFQGPTSCPDWVAADKAANATRGITDEVSTILKAGPVRVTGDRAYVVFDGRASFKQHGKPASVRGPWVTVWRKLPAGWRVEAWAFAGH